MHVCVLVSRYSSLEDARISQPKSLSRELENRPIYSWRKAFLTTVSRLAPGQMPVWSPSLPALSSSLSEMYEVIRGSTLLPSLRQCHNFSLIFLISTLLGSYNSEVAEQGVLSTLQEGSRRILPLSLTSVTCPGRDSPVFGHRYLMALGMGSLLPLCRSSPAFRGMFECPPVIPVLVILLRGRRQEFLDSWSAETIWKEQYTVCRSLKQAEHCQHQRAGGSQVAFPNIRPRFSSCALG